MANRTRASVSAQVVLRAAGGASPGGGEAVTAENVREHLPSDEAAAVTRRAFASEGFEVGELVGNSFSITAPTSTFEKVFKVKLRRDEEKGVRARAGTGGEEGYELPTGKLTGDLKRHVAAVTFTPPPDFGPTSYF